MDSTDENLLLRNIEEFVYDEEKIVTYKWLSQTLNIHPNTAKQLLEKFANQKHATGEDLYVVYLVVGITSDFSATVRVVRDQDVEVFKRNLSRVCSVNVYAINKTNFPKDLGLLYAANKVETSEDTSKCTVITCPEASIPRIVRKAVEQPPSTTGKSTTAAKPQPTTVSSTIATKPSSEVEKTKEKEKPAQKSKPATGIAAFFNGKKSEKQKPTVNKPTTVPPVSKGKNDSEGNKDSELNEKTEKLSISEKCDSRQTTKSPVKSKSDKDSGKEKQAAVTKKSESVSSKVRNKSKRNAKGPPAKKHKRIVVESESSDDDIFADTREEEDEEKEEEKLRALSPTPSEQTTSNSVENNEDKKRGPARIQKAVTKTYADEEGYIITKKEFVFEECNVDSGDEKEKKENLQQNGVQKNINKKVTEPPPKKKQKVTSPQKTKQATLMSFFKKT